jgi:hypothetical protein
MQSEDEYGKAEKQGDYPGTGADVRLLPPNEQVLLELFLRLPDLPGVHGREPLGNDLQPHNMGLPRLRQNPFLLTRIPRRLDDT